MPEFLLKTWNFNYNIFLTNAIMFANCSYNGKDYKKKYTK